MRRLTARYSPKKKSFLHSHPWCQFPDCLEPATDCHHRNKRRGARLFDDHYFMAVCREHHDWIENNKKEARMKGFLLPY
jgi:hypothetical protein